MAKYICTTCGFKAQTIKEINEQTLIYPYDENLDRFHRDCIVKLATKETEKTYEIEGKPTLGKMIYT